MNERRTESNMSPVSTSLETWLFAAAVDTSIAGGNNRSAWQACVKGDEVAILKSQVVPKNSGAFAENIFAPNTLDL